MARINFLSSVFPLFWDSPHECRKKVVWCGCTLFPRAPAIKINNKLCSQRQQKRTDRPLCNYPANPLRCFLCARRGSAQRKARNLLVQGARAAEDVKLIYGTFVKLAEQTMRCERKNGWNAGGRFCVCGRKKDGESWNLQGEIWKQMRNIWLQKDSLRALLKLQVHPLCHANVFWALMKALIIVF